MIKRLVIILWILAIAVVCYGFPSENSDGVWNSRIITRERSQYSYDNVKAYVINAAPAQPYACDAAHLGDFVYQDDTNSGTVAYICVCGIDADETTHVWLRINRTDINCW